MMAVVGAMWVLLCRSADCAGAELDMPLPEVESGYKRALHSHNFDEGDVLFGIEAFAVSDTRYLKDIRDIPSNISIVSAKEIEKHQWHTVGDILRHNGLWIFSTQDFGAGSIINIQGMEGPHILIMVDGVDWRTISGGDAETAGIPVGIIDRIEIVKGSASHAFGSALAGVVNIITKTGDTEKNGPTGSVAGNYGERSILDLRTQVAGKAWKAVYFFHIGAQDSGAMEYDRSFENQSVYGKIALPLSKNITASVMALHTAPYLGLGEHESLNFKFAVRQRIWFVKADLVARIADGVLLEFDVNRLGQKDVTMTDLLQYDTTAFYSENNLDEKRMGGGGKIVIENETHTLVMGAEFDKGDARAFQLSGSMLQSYGVSQKTDIDTESNTWGVYVNDTIVQGPWALTGGFRYDDTDASGSQTSLSLGMSWLAFKKTVFRVNYAKGFAAPPAGWSKGGWLFLDPNPELDNEEVTSYQAGFESAYLRYVWIKGNCFYHDLENAFFRLRLDSDNADSMFINHGDIRRRGFELQAEANLIHDFIVRTGFSYMHTSDSNADESARTWIINSVLGYENDRLFSAHLLGNYVRTDLYDDYNPKYEMVFDLDFSTNIALTEKTRADLYIAAHNLFNTSQYTYDFRQNAGRWVEFGVNFHF